MSQVNNWKWHYAYLHQNFKQVARINRHWHLTNMGGIREGAKNILPLVMLRVRKLLLGMRFLHLWLTQCRRGNWSLGLYFSLHANSQLSCRIEEKSGTPFSPWWNHSLNKKKTLKIQLSQLTGPEQKAHSPGVPAAVTMTACWLARMTHPYPDCGWGVVVQAVTKGIPPLNLDLVWLLWGLWVYSTDLLTEV